MRARTISLLTLVVVLVAGLLVLVVTGLSIKRNTAFSAGVQPSAPVATARPGRPVCQGPISAPDRFGGVSVFAPVGSGNRPRSALLAIVGSASGNGPTASARLKATGAQPSPVLTLSGRFSGPVPDTSSIKLCLEPVHSAGGPRPGHLALLGSSPSSWSGTVSGSRQPTALAITFLAPHPRSVLALVPTMFERASLFRAGWIGAWVFWGLLVALAAAAGIFAVSLAGAVGADAERPED
jgi:hypothetical protein